MFIMARSGAMFARMRMKSGDMDMQISLPVETAYDVPFPASNHEQWKMDIKERVIQQGVTRLPKSKEVAERQPAVGYRYPSTPAKKKVQAPKVQPQKAQTPKQPPLKFPQPPQTKQTKQTHQSPKTKEQQVLELLTQAAVGKTLQSAKFFGGRLLYRDLNEPIMAKLLSDLNISNMQQVSAAGDMLFAIKVNKYDQNGKLAWTDIHEAESSTIIRSLRSMGLLTYQEPETRKIGSLQPANSINDMIDYALRFFQSRYGKRVFNEEVTTPNGRKLKAQYVASRETASSKDFYLTIDEYDLLEDIANGYFASIEEVKRGLMTLLRGQYNGPAVIQDDTDTTVIDIPDHVISETGDIIISGNDGVDDLWYSALISAGVEMKVAERLSKASSMTAVISELSTQQQEAFLNNLENTESLNGK